MKGRKKNLGKKERINFSSSRGVLGLKASGSFGGRKRRGEKYRTLRMSTGGRLRDVRGFRRKREPTNRGTELAQTSWGGFKEKKKKKWSGRL